jgi:hypothetical protein
VPFRQSADRGAAFFAGPGRRCKISGHGEAARRYQVQIDGSEVSCHDETVLVTNKKQSTIRQLAESACNPIDFVSAAGIVQVQQNFISGLDSSFIDS